MLDAARPLVAQGASPDQIANSLGISKAQANWVVEVLKGEQRRASRAQPRPFARVDPSIFSTCQYLTDPKKRDFCGKPTHKNSSWCVKHFDICIA